MIATQVITIYAESTPNPATMKFVLNQLLIESEGRSVDYRTKEKASDSPLALKLFDFPFVRGVFITGNFVTITQDESKDWYEIIPTMKDFIKNYLISGEPIFTKVPEQIVEEANRPNTDVEQKIIGLLDEYIRPAVEGDGGAIHFKSFEDGIVTVVLKGSCSGCPSSTLTLKQGIENLLKRMVPEVEEVVSEAM